MLGDSDEDHLVIPRDVVLVSLVLQPDTREGQRVGSAVVKLWIVEKDSVVEVRKEREEAPELCPNFIRIGEGVTEPVNHIGHGAAPPGEHLGGDHGGGVQ